MEYKSLRRIFADQVIKEARKRHDIVMLHVDCKEATGIEPFIGEFPDNSYNLGIAEQNLISTAAGMAFSGLVPIVNSYGMFLWGRAFDQVRNNVCLTNANVKLVASHLGLDVGVDGVTHQITEDIAMARSLPNLVILSPADENEMRQAVKYMIEKEGPVYLRTGKTKVRDFLPSDYAFRVGVPAVLREGSEIALVSHGLMLERTVQAAEELEREGISAKVINLSTIKPVNEGVLLELLTGIGAVVTVEDHSIYGGIGSLVSEVLAENRPLPLVRVGVPDLFGETATGEELYSRFRMDTQHIISAVKNVRKKQSHDK